MYYAVYFCVSCFCLLCVVVYCVCVCVCVCVWMVLFCFCLFVFLWAMLPEIKWMMMVMMMNKYGEAVTVRTFLNTHDWIENLNHRGQPQIVYYTDKFTKSSVYQKETLL